MYKYGIPSESFLSTTSGVRTLLCKTFQVRISDNLLQLQTGNTNQFGYPVGGAGMGNARGLKVVLPGTATIAGIGLYNNAVSNTTGTGAAGQLTVGRAIPFLTMVATGATTLTVTCKFAHGLTSSDTIHIQGSGVATFDTVAATTFNGLSTFTIQNKQPLTVTPSASDPTVFTVTIPSTTVNTTSTQGVIVCTSYYTNANVQSGGLATGMQWLPVKNVGSFAATTPTAYWQAATTYVGATAPGVVSAPGTPPVWCVSGALSPLLGADGNYNYFVEPTQDAQIYAFFQEYATSGFVAATSGGPWTMFIYYFN